MGSSPVNHSESIEEGKVILLTFSNSEILSKNIQNLKDLTEKQNFSSGIYVTVNRPYESLKNILSSNNVTLDRLFFIDCITPSVNGQIEESAHCKFVSSPSDLTHLSIKISESVSSLPEGKKFLYLDSLSTLSIYNSPNDLARFCHFLIARIRILGFTGIFVAVEKRLNEDLFHELAEISDKTTVM